MKEKLLEEKENIQNKQKNQNKRLNAIEEKLKHLEEENLDRNWKPRLGDDYYFMFDDGSIGCAPYLDCIPDRARISLGNYFQTLVDVKFETERLCILAELKKYADKYSQAEWEVNIKKYYIEYDHQTNKLQISKAYIFDSGVIYFRSIYDAQKAIDSIGADKIIKYYFRVGDQSE